MYRKFETLTTFYKSDTNPIELFIRKYLAVIERKLWIPDSVSKFGYEGIHLIFLIPKDIITPEIESNFPPVFFELQIKTLFQHAWAEADHDLAYKPQKKLDDEQERKIAFTAAQAWGADLIFNDLAKSLGIFDN
ncbi:MAG: hypothetical protein HPY72_05785 [Anaerolineae bacterium]|nr:hypothetical protein [Anaerolineae bacterium]